MDYLNPALILDVSERQFYYCYYYLTYKINQKIIQITKITIVPKINSKQKNNI